MPKHEENSIESIASKTIFGALVGQLIPLATLIVVAVVCLVAWFAYIVPYHLGTAIAGFLAGTAFIVIITRLDKKFIASEHSYVMLLPIILGILGYAVEYLNIWKLPLDITLHTNEIAGLTDIILTINIVLATIATSCAVIQVTKFRK